MQKTANENNHTCTHSQQRFYNMPYHVKWHSQNIIRANMQMVNEHINNETDNSDWVEN